MFLKLPMLLLLRLFVCDTGACGACQWNHLHSAEARFVTPAEEVGGREVLDLRRFQAASPVADDTLHQLRLAAAARADEHQRIEQLRGLVEGQVAQQPC